MLTLQTADFSETLQVLGVLWDSDLIDRFRLPISEEWPDQKPIIRSTIFGNRVFIQLGWHFGEFLTCLNIMYCVLMPGHPMITSRPATKG